MIDKILHNLQRDICDEKGHYRSYIHVLCMFLLFSIVLSPYKQMKLILNIPIFILSVIAFLFLILINFRCKDSRSQRESKEIVKNIIFFLLLTLASIYNLIKNLN